MRVSTRAYVHARVDMYVDVRLCICCIFSHVCVVSGGLPARV